MMLFADAKNNLDSFVGTLPHRHWVEGFLKKNQPSVLNMAAEVNPHGLKVAGTSLNGLALTFFPVSGHRDCDDRTPGLMTYLQGPFEETWMGGAFLVRMFGLRVPVQPNDLYFLIQISGTKSIVLLVFDSVWFLIANSLDLFLVDYKTHTSQRTFNGFLHQTLGYLDGLVITFHPVADHWDRDEPLRAEQTLLRAFHGHHVYTHGTSPNLVPM